MDHHFLPHSLWTSEGKFLHHNATVLYSSVHVMCNIPAGAQFGPCILQNTFHDTIAFIALKSCDKRSKSYVFRVDPEAMQSSALVLSWLRLVQAARHREEQNTEAFLKGGQLYFRTTKEIHQDEELLVWYDQELSHLLGFTDISTRGHNAELKCAKCNQVFKNEHPYLAHCRFLCSQVKNDMPSREAYEHKHIEIKRQHRITDFHNIARDLEHKESSASEEAEISLRKRKHEETDYHRWRKPVLLEKTNILNDNITQITRDYHLIAPESTGSDLKLKAEKYQLKKDKVECKNSAFTEVGDAKRSVMHEKEKPTDADSETVRKMGSGLNSKSNNSEFSFVLRSGQEEQKSAFCKPSKGTSSSNCSTAHPSNTPAPSNHLEDARDIFTSKTVLGYNNLLASNNIMLNGDLPGAQTLPTPVTCNAFPYPPEHWSRSIGAQIQTTSLTILPPTFSSFGVSVQNWCAKCNLSFRMTSDLVFHMRSHHKKEFLERSRVRRREEKLTCPICHEFFRERHHLSRHMTSHN
ncbi:PR domain zinc finger protein 8 [Salmo trutta]|uniref:Zinc finger protein 488 n=1 Tax=Salmo trutta TaxID=8032 RepID=A0A673WYH7_SALTR|nr:PR domain zinc finger protein 8-like [Salmo trutta]XP_029553792.1 PR domain zinc finger protein 8-like [Salmo trutta]XP_029553793.1 PR domain zinc finger protein 8-like [Salmo trutta]